MSTRKISAEEYVTSSKAEGRWVAINGVIYDFTKFNHPGGNKIIAMYVGADGSTRFNDHHNDNRLERTAGTKGLVRIGVQGWERDPHLGLHPSKGKIINPQASRRSRRIRNIPQEVEVEKTIPAAKVVKNKTKAATPQAPKTPRKPKTPEPVTPRPPPTPKTPKAPKKPSKPAKKPKTLEPAKPKKRVTTKKAPADPAKKALVKKTPVKKRKRDEGEEALPTKKAPAKKAALKKALTKKPKHTEEEKKRLDPLWDYRYHYIC